MAIDSRGIEYDPFLPSVSTADGRVYQVIVTDPETGERATDMEASTAAAAADAG